MTYSMEWQKISKTHQDLISSLQVSFPIPLGELAKRLNISVKVATLPADISGEIKEEDKVVTIRINRHDVKERQRFTLAHEIAHYFLHREHLSNGITDNKLYRSSLSDELEVEANRLAADIVMPWHLIKECQNRFLDIGAESRIEKIAEEAQVSTTAMKIRLGKI